jgi:hypothetical protein
LLYSQSLFLLLALIALPIAMYEELSLNLFECPAKSSVISTDIFHVSAGARDSYFLQTSVIFLFVGSAEFLDQSTHSRQKVCSVDRYTSQVTAVHGNQRSSHNHVKISPDIVLPRRQRMGREVFAEERVKPPRTFAAVSSKARATTSSAVVQFPCPTFLFSPWPYLSI